MTTTTTTVAILKNNIIFWHRENRICHVLKWYQKNKRESDIFAYRQDTDAKHQFSLLSIFFFDIYVEMLHRPKTVSDAFYTGKMTKVKHQITITTTITMNVKNEVKLNY